MIVRLRNGAADTDARLVRRGDARIRLAPKEAALLERLAAASPAVVERATLLAEVWGYRPGVGSKTLESTVYTLRTKVEADPRAPAQLQAVPGVGYRWLAVAEPRRAALVGRDADLARLTALVVPGALVVVHGPPGVGKTALLSAFADDFAGPVHRVELGADPEAALAAALGVPLGPPDPVGRALGSVEGLVLLDHGDVPARWRDVPTAAALVWATADLPPDARTVLPLAALALPPRSPASVADLVAAPAGELLWRAATAAWPPLADDPPLAALAGLAHALDGLPGALLLAASRLATTSAADLLARADRLAGDVVSRLDPAERRALANLARLPGPFPLDLAEQLLAADVLDRLVRRSVVERLPDRDGAGSYRLLAAVRARAAALDADPEVPARVRAWLGALGAALPAISRPDEALRARLVEALDALEAHDDDDPDLARAAAAARFVVGPWERALAHLERARPTPAVRRDRAELLARMGRFDEARACLAPSDVLVRALVEERGGDPALAAELAAAADGASGYASLYLGNALSQLGRITDAQRAWTEAQARFAVTGDLRGVARASANLAAALFQTGDLLGSADEAARAEAIDRRLGDRLGLASDLLQLHRLARARGDSAGALAALAEATGLQRSLGNAPGEARVLQMAAVFHLEAGDPRAALHAARDGIARVGPGHAQRPSLLQLEGEARLALGDPAGARAAFEQALAEGRPRQRVEARCGLARIAADASDPAARELLAAARSEADPDDEPLARVLDAAEAFVRARLPR